MARNCLNVYFVLAFLFASLMQVALADIYMHNPRGSNNRNCEHNVNRNNANRLFDSQNNGAGGYACPRKKGGPEIVTPTMYYYVGSVLPIEWTSQHSCGTGNGLCNYVIQYMCEDTAPGVRDGTPNDANDPATYTVDENTNNSPNVGVHEPIDNYKKCRTRRRNTGLFIADQRQENPGSLSSNSPATQTRQNPGGNRYGWECAEERDYWPYWHPTPWKDIAIYTHNTSMCEWYKSESQNVKEKGECFTVEGNPASQNNYQDCLSEGNVWNVTKPHGIPPPECLSVNLIATRDNHLGNSVNLQMQGYNWTIPDDPHKRCVLRVRYNITTGDYHPFETDSKLNFPKSPVKQDPFEKFGYNHYLSLAMNTNQYGRTFQDRSYVFEIKSRPKEVPSWAKIYNLNVRGKRGNIVQVYPSVEYDFVPNYLEAKGGEYLHIQWTGSDYNPPRNPNDAEGAPNTGDRSNFVQMDYPHVNFPRLGQHHTMFMDEDGKADTNLVTKLAFVNQPITNSSLCLSPTELLEKNGKNKALAEQDERNCGKLNAASPYFDAGLVVLRTSGKFNYMCTRNNNFSNRSQKGTLIVTGGKFNSSSTLQISTLLMVLSALIVFMMQ
ncbi:hypothetical protein ABK040_014362 [Willaertia magna]